MKTQHIRSGSLEALRSLRRIHVKVDSLPSEVKAAGLSAQTLEQDILTDLKEAPVGTLTEIGILHVRGRPTLHIRVSLSESESGLCPYGIVVELCESVHAKRLMATDLGPPLTAPTWRVEALGAVPTDDLSSLKEEVSVLIGEFIKDLRSAKQEQNEA
jgi:hypothetical protein